MVPWNINFSTTNQRKKKYPKIEINNNKNTRSNQPNIYFIKCFIIFFGNRNSAAAVLSELSCQSLTLHEVPTAYRWDTQNALFHCHRLCITPWCQRTTSTRTTHWTYVSPVTLLKIKVSSLCLHVIYTRMSPRTNKNAFLFAIDRIFWCVIKIWKALTLLLIAEIKKKKKVCKKNGKTCSRNARTLNVLGRENFFKGVF